MRAGVFPWLVQPGVVDGIGLWRWLILKPSEISGDLFDGLATALLGPTALPEAASEGKAGLIAAQLRESPASLGLWIMEALDRAAETVQRTETLPRPVAVPETSTLSMGCNRTQPEPRAAR